MPKSLNLIVACAENRVIGRDGKLPWRIPEDWRLFKKLTAGKIVIVGRISFSTWKSVLEDERRAIVLTHDKTVAHDGVQVAESLTSALALAEKMPGEIFICGGQRIFEEAIALPRVEQLYLTLVHAQVDGDRYFPEWRDAFPRVIEQREGFDENYRYTFYVLGR